LKIEEAKPPRFFPENGLLLPEYVEADLLKNGVRQNKFSIILLIYHPPQGGGNFGGMKILGKSGYSFFQFPCKTSVFYPGDNPEINYAATWLFIHELQHSIDLVCYEGSGVSDMWHGDQPLDYSIRAGEQFSYQAEIFRQFNKYNAIKSPWGKIDQSIDRDGDGLPDDDHRLPFDEIRFGSDTLKADSDDDGLNDLEEFMAGIYQGCQPKIRDTDSDGLLDGKDVLPLHKIVQQIPQITPQWESNWSSWFLISDELDFCSTNFLFESQLQAKIFINWDDAFLYFGCEMDAPAHLHLDIDLLNNGWWHGKDNYRLVIDPFSQHFYEIRVMDATDEARKWHESLGKGYFEMWDDEPEYRAQFGKILDEFSVKLKTQVFEKKYIIKLAIPNNDRVPFTLKKNQEIGWRIYFTDEGFGSSIPLATVYEQYEFFPVMLK